MEKELKIEDVQEKDEVKAIEPEETEKAEENGVTSVLKNQPCYDKDGNPIGWLSRAVAVAAAIFVRDSENNCFRVLASQRGEGTPDPEYVGAYNAVCGYLDYGETLEETAIREIREETGIVVDCPLTQLDIISDPKENKRQNVVVRYYGLLAGDVKDYEAQISHEGNEPGEVDDIRFMTMNEIDGVRWAFHHKEFIRKAMLEILGKFL